MYLNKQDFFYKAEIKCTFERISFDDFKEMVAILYSVARYSFVLPLTSVNFFPAEHASLRKQEVTTLKWILMHFKQERVYNPFTLHLLSGVLVFIKVAGASL